MFKINYPKLIFSVRAFYKLKKIRLNYKNQTFILDENPLELEYHIEKLNDCVQMEFSNFTTEESQQRVEIKVYYNGVEKDSTSLCTFFMKNNKYVKNIQLAKYNSIHFNGILTINFFKRWFECNILEGRQILDNKNLPVQWIRDYSECSLRIDTKIQEYDIVCLGCSYTYGSGLENEQSWPKILENKTKLKTGNFATPACGIDGIYKQFLFVKQNFKTKKIFILLPIFERKRYKFQFGEYPVELLFTNNNAGQLVGKKQLRVMKEKLLLRKKIGCRYIKLLSKDSNVFMSSWANDVYENIPIEKRLPQYPNLETFQERATDGTHPSYKHNELFVEKIIQENNNLNVNS